MSLFNWSSLFSSVPSNETSQLQVHSSDIQKQGDTLISNFEYRRNEIISNGNGLSVTPKRHQYCFKTNLKPKKTGLLLVGLGGNNGSTVVGAIIANKQKLSWKTRYVWHF